MGAHVTAPQPPQAGQPQPVAAWAAVLGETDVRVAKRGHGSFLGIQADEPYGVVLAMVILPPGVRAAQLGRSNLTPGTSEWSAAGLGKPQGVSLRIPAWCAMLCKWVNSERFDGEAAPTVLDVPVWVDPVTGKVLDVEHEGLVQELWPYHDLALDLWRSKESPLSGVRSAARAPKSAGRFVKSFFGDWGEAFADIKSGFKSVYEERPTQAPRPDDTTHPPIEGVGYQTWITVSALLQRDEVHPLQLDAFTTYRGVPSGRWIEVDAAWQQRAQTDPVVAEWATYDRKRMLPTGAQWMMGEPVVQQPTVQQPTDPTPPMGGE
jgi:hypothetical protein